MGRGRVRFVGCGPGARDLLTLRAVAAIAAADVVIWSPSLIEEGAVLEHARTGAELVAWPPATARDVDAVYDRAAAGGLEVVRLKGGDPTIFGELRDELLAVRGRGLECEIVPGVSAVAAGAAALGCEIAGPGAPLLLVGAGEGARPAGTIAVLNAGHDAMAVAGDLLARGLPAATPCAVLVGISRPGELLVRCVLEDLGETLGDYGATGLTIVLAGRATAGESPDP